MLLIRREACSEVRLAARGEATSHGIKAPARESVTRILLKSNASSA